MNSSLVEDNMHVHEVLRAVTRSSLSPPLRLLIMAMCADATRINFTTGVYTGSLADLAAATGYSDSSIRRHWRALKASGWVDVIERSGMSSVITLTPLTPGQDEPGSKMTPPVKMTPGTPGQDDPHPPVILTPPYKNKEEDQKNEEEEEARTVRAKTRDAAATAAAPNSITRQVRTERDAERQEQQAPVESVRDADQAEGHEWEYTDYVDAIRQGHRDTGLMCHDMTHHHDRLVRLAMEEGWTPERLRQDVAANLGSYRKRNVNWHARMLVSDMGKRSAPSNLGAAMEVSHNNVVRQLGRAEVNAQRASNLWGMS